MGCQGSMHSSITLLSAIGFLMAKSLENKRQHPIFGHSQSHTNMENSCPSHNTNQFINLSLLHKQQQTKPTPKKERNITPQLIIIGSVHKQLPFPLTLNYANQAPLAVHMWTSHWFTLAKWPITPFSLEIFYNQFSPLCWVLFL